MNQLIQKSRTKGLVILISICLLGVWVLPVQAAPKGQSRNRRHNQPVYHQPQRRPVSHAPARQQHARGRSHSGPSRDVANAVAIGNLALDVIDGLVRWSNPQPTVVVQSTSQTIYYGY